MPVKFAISKICVNYFKASKEETLNIKLTAGKCYEKINRNRK